MKATDIKVGQIFSESSHYVVEKITGNYIKMKHFESDKTVTLDTAYVTNLLDSADYFTKEVKVNKEDSKDGQILGIRSIWENISTEQVFTVCYIKQDNKKTKAEIKTEKDKVINTATAMIDKAKKDKKSMAIAYKNALEYVQNNPVIENVPGKQRILRGCKKQFFSRDGRYDCIDMEINEIRPVNINTIQWLIIDGVKYIVK